MKYSEIKHHIARGKIVRRACWANSIGVQWDTHTSEFVIVSDTGNPCSGLGWYARTEDQEARDWEVVELERNQTYSWSMFPKPPQP